MLVNTSKQVYFNKAGQILFKHNDLKVLGKFYFISKYTSKCCFFF